MGRFAGDEITALTAWAERHRRGQRRRRAVAYLGGRCAGCGATADLEFAHVDPATKVFSISGNLNRRWEVLVPELDKCQLLCHECRGGDMEIPHGTVSGYTYWKCRCIPCWEARMAYRRAWAARTGKRL